MKILIVYYSMTGNTEMVAKSMQDALVGQDVTLTRVEDLDPSGFKGYDLVLLGSGIYAGRFHKTIKKFLKETTKLPPKFALFYTHATQDAETYQPFPRNIRKLIEKGESSICGEFECLGENKNIPEEQVQAR